MLRAFDALLREGSVSRASAQLHLSQPATSALLAKLRELFGDPLFLRHARGITATTRALQLAEPVRRILAELRDLLEPAQGFDPAQSTRTFRVAMNDYASTTLLAPLLGRLAQSAPRLRLATLAPHLDDLHTRMTDGEVDAAILVRSRVPRGLVAQPLFEEDFVLALPAAHPLAAKRRISAADVAGLRHVMVSPVAPDFAGIADRRLQALGLQRTVQASVNSFAAAVDAVARGGLAALLPRRLAQSRAPQVVVRKPPFAMPALRMDWVTHPRSAHDAGLAWLRDALAQLTPHHA